MHHLGHLALLKTLFGKVIVPPAVVQELVHPRPRFPAIDVASMPFIEIRSPGNTTLLHELQDVLDAGEAEAIVLAKELNAEWLLIDESDGRRIAAEKGVPIMGVLGVLIRAKDRGLVSAVLPLAHRLRDELGFFLSEATLAEARRLAGE